MSNPKRELLGTILAGVATALSRRESQKTGHVCVLYSEPGRRQQPRAAHQSRSDPTTVREGRGVARSSE